MVTKILLDKEKASLQARSSFNLQNQNKNLPLNTTEPDGAQIQQQHQRNLQSRKTLRDYQKKQIPIPNNRTRRNQASGPDR